MVEEYRISYCLFLTAIMIASDNWLNLFKNDFKVKTDLHISTNAAHIKGCFDRALFSFQTHTNGVIICSNRAAKQEH